ncbi:MAG: hypothetical protein ACFFDW_01485 [Candidatus Thorarchaeota archaeon]
MQENTKVISNFTSITTLLVMVVTVFSSLAIFEQHRKGTRKITGKDDLIHEKDQTGG